MRVQNISVKSKLIAAVAVPLAALLVSTLVSLHIMHILDQGVDRIYNERVVPLKRVKQIADDYAVLVVDAVNKANAGISTPAQALKNIRDASASVRQNWKAFVDTHTTGREAKLAAEVSRLSVHADRELARLEQKLTALGSDAKGKLAEFDGPLYRVIDPLGKKLDELIELQLDLARQERDQADHLYEQSRSLFIAGSVAVLLLVVALGWLVYRSVATPLAKLRTTIEEVAADSDLTRKVDIDARDELGATAAAFNRMLDSIKEVIDQITGATAQLASASEEMSAISEQTHQGIRRQLSETDQVATAMNEMSSTVQEVARHAADASESTQQADSRAAEGNRVVGQVVSSIKDLTAELQNTAQVIHTVEAESDHIGSVLDVIRGIAEQTNLLALNAAIEAARAGEQGRGFAVVADEVRTLASRTQQSTQEIQAMIERLQNGAKGAVQAMDHGQSRAQQSVEQAVQAGEALDEITRSVSGITDMNTQIASAAEEQGAVAEEINRNVISINDIAGQTAQGAQQASTASEELARLAAELQGMVGRFKTG